MLSVCTTDLYGDLLCHQDVIDGNIQDDAESQHVVDTGKGIAPEPLMHRAHISYAKHPSDSCDRIPAVPDQHLYIRTGSDRINDRIIHFSHHSFPNKNTASSGQESGISQ